jgi:hypothetical protein
MAAQRQDLIRAIELAIAGDWTAAHGIVQQDEAGLHMAQDPI